jgi:16S rRNA (uracil1498-N3)-methyltransferase
MQLFYDKEINPEASLFTFSQEESKHIVKVLRKKIDDILYLTNGKGYRFECWITAADPKKCTVAIRSVLQIDQRPYRLHMAVAPTKMNDRFEWFLEKATEIGIDEITPLICENSERKMVKTDRLEKVVQAAMKQSLQSYLPLVHGAIPFKEFVAKPPKGSLFIAHCEEDAKQGLKSLLVPNTDITILIGPEGDFSPSEIKLALKNGFLPVSLGETRLRTETAAVYACTGAAWIHTP